MKILFEPLWPEFNFCTMVMTVSPIFLLLCLNEKFSEIIRKNFSNYFSNLCRYVKAQYSVIKKKRNKNWKLCEKEEISKMLSRVYNWNKRNNKRADPT